MDRNDAQTLILALHITIAQLTLNAPSCRIL